MYERNAIVLERYFYKIFKFTDDSNLRDNYYNYRKLFECYGALCESQEKEKQCNEEFLVANKEIENFQKEQEKLYNKSAKFEYSRYIIFCNSTEKVENIEKHLNKVNEDVQKNNEALRELGEKFVMAVKNYNEKKENLKALTESREKAQKEYDEVYLNAKNCYEGITEEIIKYAKAFISSDNKDNKNELQSIFEDNGKKEKNQFDPDVISNTISKSFDIYKQEIEVYLTGYDRISKLFEEIETNTVKIDKHTKYYKDSKGKLDFLNAEKEYIVQFLDNERIGAIYDKKTHRKLMLEACKKFVLDFEQIEKLFDIIVKEAAGRWTKKIYKENYNKEYLLNLENASVEPSLDTSRMRQDAIALMNLNYWRFEGMSSVYNIFENIVTTIYERDLSEFLPAQPEPEVVEDVVENKEDFKGTSESIESLDSTEDTNNISDIQIQSKEKSSKIMPKETEVSSKSRVVYRSSKIALANAIYYSLQTQEFAPNEENIEEEIYEIPENVQEILEESEDSVEEVKTKQKSDNLKEENIYDLSKLDNIDEEDDTEDEEVKMFDIENDEKYIEDEELYETDDTDGDSILDIYFSDSKNKGDSASNDTGKKVGLFKKLVGFNSKSKKEEV